MSAPRTYRKFTKEYKQNAGTRGRAVGCTSRVVDRLPMTVNSLPLIVGPPF